MSSWLIYIQDLLNPHIQLRRTPTKSSLNLECKRTHRLLCSGFEQARSRGRNERQFPWKHCCKASGSSFDLIWPNSSQVPRSSSAHLVWELIGDPTSRGTKASISPAGPPLPVEVRTCSEDITCLVYSVPSTARPQGHNNQNVVPLPRGFYTCGENRDLWIVQVTQENQKDRAASFYHESSQENSRSDNVNQVMKNEYSFMIHEHAGRRYFRPINYEQRCKGEIIREDGVMGWCRDEARARNDHSTSKVFALIYINHWEPEQVLCRRTTWSNLKLEFLWKQGGQRTWKGKDQGQSSAKGSLQ